MDPARPDACMRYEYEIDKLWTGANYGNLEAYARAGADSDMLGLWSAVDDQHYCGKWQISFFAEGDELGPHTTIFEPAHQTTNYHGHGLSISKTFLLPYGDGFKRAAYFIIKARNSLDRPQQFGIVCDIAYPEFTWPDYVKTADMGQKRKRFTSEIVGDRIVSRTDGREQEVRVIGGTLPFDVHFFSKRGASLTYSVTLEPGEEREEAFVMVIGSHGADRALAELEDALDYRTVFQHTRENMARVVATADLWTPDALINRAVRWAKVNIAREQKSYPCGPGFTNDPPQDVLVVRDAAWFALGTDYLAPEFSTGMLDLISRHGIEDGGKITEFILCCENPVFKHDYDLSINDNSPLFMIAAYHNYALTGDRDFLDRIYPAVRDCAHYILGQRRDGLVYCDSEEANAWGICGWRNIIPEYQISGFPTEVNCECCLALRLAGELAQVVGDPDHAEMFRREAEALREAINRELVSRSTGFYVLNIAPDGRPNEILSGDQIFPVITGVADDEMSARILDLLAQPEFRTGYGIRTVAVGQKGYDPEFGVRLMGGIWPNLTCWVAYGNRRHNPDFMVDAMRNVYRISESPVPRELKNIVPGEFPECLHGENYESRGMALSPWVPPTYLWLAMEGPAGIEPSIDGRLHVNPNLPRSWSSLALLNVPWNGRYVSFFVHEGKLYSNVELISEYPQETFERDVTSHIKCEAYTVALSGQDETVIFVASDSRQNVRVELDRELSQQPRTFELSLNPGEARVLRVAREG